MHFGQYHWRSITVRAPVREARHWEHLGILGAAISDNHHNQAWSKYIASSQLAYSLEDLIVHSVERAVTGAQPACPKRSGPRIAGLSLTATHRADATRKFVFQHV